jgi:hypothetical protein
MDRMYGDNANVVAFGTFECGVGSLQGHYSWDDQDIDIGEFLEMDTENQLEGALDAPDKQVCILDMS